MAEYPVGCRMSVDEYVEYRQAHPEDGRVLGLSGHVVIDVTADLPVDSHGKPLLGVLPLLYMDKKGVVSDEAMQKIDKIRELIGNPQEKP